MKSSYSHYYQVCGVLLISALLLVGCEVTSEKIKIWKQSDKGAAKIRAAIRDTGQKMPIRIEAAMALAEMGFVTPLEDDMKAISEGDKKQIVQALGAGLLQKMKGSNPQATSRIQVQAKDALFTVRKLVEPDLRRTIEEEIVTWIIGDYNERNQGEHSAEKIIKEIGQPAGDVLAENLTNEGSPLVGISILLRRVGTQAARDKGAKKLVALAQKQDPPQMATFIAMGRIGSEHTVDYMQSVASKKGKLEYRVWALRALALYPMAKVIPMAKAIAGDATLKDDQAILRDDAFTLLERIGKPQCLEVLVQFLNDKDEKVRFRAVEAIISGFREKGLTRLLDGLPPGYTYKKIDIEDFIEKDVIALGPKALPPLRKMLASESWIAKLVAARILGKVGTKIDIPALMELAKDQTAIKGWDGVTVGSQAKAAADTIKNRK